jgi:hypothetical protein
LERLEVRLAPALVGRDAPALAVPAPDTVQVTSLVQALAGSSGFGTPAAFTFGGLANLGPLSPTIGASPLSLAQGENGSFTLLTFSTNLPSSPFARLVLVEAPVPEPGNAQGPSAFVVLQVLEPQPVVPPAAVFALVGQQPNVPPAPNPASLLPFSSVRGFVFPIDFPANLADGVRGLFPTRQHSGTIATASVGGQVFQDKNGNGVQEAFEPGLEGVRMTLELWQGDEFLPVATTVTDAAGRFSFTRLRPGTYRVRPAVGRNQHVTGQHIRPIPVGPAVHATQQDFGLAPGMRRAEAERPTDERTGAALLLPQALTDWVFEEWTGGRPPHGRSEASSASPASTDALLGQAVVLQDEGLSHEPESSGLVAAEVVALMTAVVAEFEGVGGDERDRRPRVALD